MSTNKPRVCWVDDIFNLLPWLWFPVASCIIALLCSVIAIIPLWLSHQIRLADAPALVLGTPSLAIVFGYCRWASFSYERTMRGIQKIIKSESQRSFDSQKKNIFYLVGRSRRSILPGMLLWAGICAVWYLAWFDYIPRIRFASFMPESWYLVNGLQWRYVTVALFAFPVVVTAYTGGRWLILHVVFMCKISRLSFIQSPRVCLRRTKPALRFGIVAALAWSWGTGMFAYLYRQDWDAASVLLVGSLGCIGAAGFVIPLVVIRGKLLELKEQRIEAFENHVIERTQNRSLDRESIADLRRLEEQIEFNDKLDAWFVSWEYALPFVGSIVIPILTVALQAQLDMLLKQH